MQCTLAGYIDRHTNHWYWTIDPINNSSPEVRLVVDSVVILMRGINRHYSLTNNRHIAIIRLSSLRVPPPYITSSLQKTSRLHWKLSPEGLISFVLSSTFPSDSPIPLGGVFFLTSCVLLVDFGVHAFIVFCNFPPPFGVAGASRGAVPKPLPISCVVALTVILAGERDIVLLSTEVEASDVSL